jgi:hypothetical protein
MLLRKAHQPGFVRGRVLRVVRLDAIHADGSIGPKPAFESLVGVKFQELRVRDQADSPGPVDQRGARFRAEGLFLDVGRAVVGKKPGERRAYVRDDTRRSRPAAR